jgi:hypothetical protein
VRDFCKWYAQIRTVKDAPQPAPFDLDAFMMDGIRALALAAAKRCGHEVRSLTRRR